MSIVISGIEAAWREKEGASLFVDGNRVVFNQNGYMVEWPCKTHKEALRTITLFRAATKYPQTRCGEITELPPKPTQPA